VRYHVAATACVMLAMSLPSYANGLFETRMRVLNAKADQCKREITSTGIAGRLCDSFERYQDIIFRGSASRYIDHHMSNGDINASNQALVLHTIKNVALTSKLMLEATQ